MSTAPLLAALVVGVGLSASLAPHPTANRGRIDGPVPVRLVLDRTRYAPGAHGLVHVKTGQRGYLLVLYVEPSGHINIALPIDPGITDAVPADTDIEVRGRGGRDVFVIDDSSGVGTWYAAISARPFQFDSIAINGHWDYRVVPRVSSDTAVEADLTAFVERIATDRFDYDIVSFTIDTAAALSTSSALAVPVGPAAGTAPPVSPTDDPSWPDPRTWAGGWWGGWADPWWLPRWPGPYYDRAIPTPVGPGAAGAHIGGVTAPAGSPAAPPSKTQEKPSPRRGGEGSSDRGRHGSG